MNWASYADGLMKAAEQRAQAGRLEEAIAGYLMAADIFLTLAKGETTYKGWLDYATKAELCQKRVRELMKPYTGQG
jgi:hypothetical protein